MKNIFKAIFFIAIVSILGTSCEKDEYKYTYDGPTIGQLTTRSGTFFVLENASDPYQMKVQLIGTPQTSDVSLNFSFVDSALINGNWEKATLMPEDGIVSVGGNSITIPAGESFGYLSFSGIYDSLDFGVVDTMILQLADGDIPADIYESTYLLKVQKYYPYLEDEYPGHYSGTYWGSIYGGEGPAVGLDVIIGEDPQTLVITSGFYQEQINDWGETWTDGPFPITVYMNTDDPTNFTVEIPEVQYIGTTNDTWDYWAQPYPAPGQFNAATKELEIRYYVSVYGGDQPPQDIGVYYVKLDAATAKYLEDNGVTSVPVVTK